MKKKFLIAVGVLFLSGCAQSTALLGPAVIGGQSGSVYKASLHYSSGYLIKEFTGKSASEHAMSLVQEPIKIRKEKKIKKDLTKLLNKHLFSTKKKLFKNN